LRVLLSAEFNLPGFVRSWIIHISRIEHWSGLAIRTVKTGAEMRSFVQYRNADNRGPLDGRPPDLRVFTNKPASFVEELLGDTVWLIEGAGKPRSYHILLAFAVDEIGPCDDADFRFYLRGSRGRVFTPAVPIPYDDWFRLFMRHHGNFAFGLQAMRPEDATQLSRLAGWSIE
jgi:hypothetical protein